MSKKKALEILRELVARFEYVCPDEIGGMAAADARRIELARIALSVLAEGEQG